MGTLKCSHFVIIIYSLLDINMKPILEYLQKAFENIEGIKNEPRYWKLPIGFFDVKTGHSTEDKKSWISQFDYIEWYAGFKEKGNKEWWIITG